ncbi:MAG: T9SS type A sorting domain-containing protein [Paludibacteraceae bacterium]|nr:T9SS type A sorting domain-containing protein [Paludibacteraceae bacterium]
MKRIYFIIFSLLTAMVATAQVVTMEVECGDWIEISAKTIPNYIFTHWSDGSTDSVRQIQVNEDAVYIAYFHAKCGDYAELPLVNRYDWILMVNVKWLVQERGFVMAPELVHWYRVIGEVDKIEDPDLSDPRDYYLGEGYSFTLDENLRETGVYYATIEQNSDSTLFCSGLSRTELAYFVAPPRPRELRLLPNVATPNGTIRLLGLNPDIQTNIRIYSVTGQLLNESTTIGAEEYLITTYPNTGVYEVQILSDEDHAVLRYLVRQ